LKSILKTKKSSDDQKQEQQQQPLNSDLFCTMLRIYDQERKGSGSSGDWKGLASVIDAVTKFAADSAASAPSREQRQAQLKQNRARVDRLYKDAKVRDERQRSRAVELEHERRESEASQEREWLAQRERISRQRQRTSSSQQIHSSKHSQLQNSKNNDDDENDDEITSATDCGDDEEEELMPNHKKMKHFITSPSPTFHPPRPKNSSKDIKINQNQKKPRVENDHVDDDENDLVNIIDQELNRISSRNHNQKQQQQQQCHYHYSSSSAYDADATTGESQEEDEDEKHETNNQISKPKRKTVIVVVKKARKRSSSAKERTKIISNQNSIPRNQAAVAVADDADRGAMTLMDVLCPLNTSNSNSNNIITAGKSNSSTSRNRKNVSEKSNEQTKDNEELRALGKKLMTLQLSSRFHPS
jgi:hypothetical protein